MSRAAKYATAAAAPRRPLRGAPASAIQAALDDALASGDGGTGAECIHELWMRGEMGLNVERSLERLWRAAAGSVPDWLPMRHVEWLPRVYEIAARCESESRGRSNLYLILLDYPDSERGPYGIYVGMSEYSAAERFDQHKAGIRAAGSVLKRGLEVLTGPVAHLQRLARREAERIEQELAEALRADGLLVQGGH